MEAKMEEEVEYSQKNWPVCVRLIFRNLHRVFVQLPYSQACEGNYCNRIDAVREEENSRISNVICNQWKHIDHKEESCKAESDIPEDMSALWNPIGRDRVCLEREASTQDQESHKQKALLHAIVGETFLRRRLVVHKGALLEDVFRSILPAICEIRYPLI